MTIEHIAVIALAVEVIIMVSARVGTERRHWKHAKGRGTAPSRTDDVTVVSGALYAIAATAMAVGAVTASVEPTLKALGTFALFGILLPAFAANAVLVLTTRGNPATATTGRRGLAFAVAACGGILSVGLI
ncbi:hypothetical protein [Streptomyces sp. NPDC085937]|uniref:hypothetical protein n=1 Tax=Streptomyces sp. NPDC085937 TaxID=3365742 RepID=UPI0037D0B328